jgi:hypothetical protein
MKNNLLGALISFIMLFSFSAKAQELAVTELGDTVILYSNGTWVYKSDYTSDADTMATLVIRMGSKKYTKSPASVKKATGKNQAYSIFYNEKVWKRVPVADLNADADMAFKYNNGDAYSIIIFEELEIPMDNLSEIALNNALEIAPDMQIVDREYRVVNGDTLVFMRMDGTTQGIAVTYYSYYYSNKKCSVQFCTYTGQGLVEKYKKDLEDLLNGFVATKP